MKLLFSLYEMAARLGVPIGTILELVERGAILPHGFAYEQSIPLFEERDIEKARAWLAEHGDKLPLRASESEDENGSTDH